MTDRITIKLLDDICKECFWVEEQFCTEENLKRCKKEIEDGKPIYKMPPGACKERKNNDKTN